MQNQWSPLPKWPKSLRIGARLVIMLLYIFAAGSRVSPERTKLESSGVEAMTSNARVDLSDLFHATLDLTQSCSDNDGVKEAIEADFHARV